MQSAVLLFRGRRHGCGRAGLEQQMLRRNIAGGGDHPIDGARAARYSKSGGTQEPAPEEAFNGQSSGNSGIRPE
jgi:hypothetical protein